MVQYKCNTCGKIYHHKNDYNKHLNRKNPCIAKFENISIYNVLSFHFFEFPFNRECTVGTPVQSH